MYVLDFLCHYEIFLRLEIENPFFRFCLKGSCLTLLDLPSSPRSASPSNLKQRFKKDIKPSFCSSDSLACFPGLCSVRTIDVLVPSCKKEADSQN